MCPIKLMVVDDEAAVCDSIRRSLEKKRQFSVVTTTFAAEALDLARAENPEVILLDILMPGVGGLEVASRLRADKNLAKIPIIFLTGLFTKSEINKHGPVINGERYIAKPASTAKIIETVRSVLGLEDVDTESKGERRGMALRP